MQLGVQLHIGFQAKAELFDNTFLNTSAYTTAAKGSHEANLKINNGIAPIYKIDFILRIKYT